MLLQGDSSAPSASKRCQGACICLLLSGVSDKLAGDEEEDRADGQEAEEGEVEEGQGATALLRSESSLDAASFWDNLLQETWQRLQREEEAAMAAAGPPALAGRRTSRDHGGLGTPGHPGGNSSLAPHARKLHG